MNQQKNNVTKVTTKNSPKKGRSNKKKKNISNQNLNQNQKSLKQKVGVHLSPCSGNYLMALTDTNRAVAPCIPDMISIPSLKFTVRNRGQFNVGSTGFGYLIVNPSAMAYNDGPTFAATPPAANAFVPAILSTNGSYAENGFKFCYGAGAVTGGVDATNGNSSFARAALLGAGGVQVKYRLVGASAQINYIGTELNISGIVTSSFSRGTDTPAILPTAAAAITTGNILRDPAAHFKGETSMRKSHFVTYLPTDPEWDFGYYDINNRMGPYIGTNSSTSTSHDGYSLFLGVSGVPASTAYTYEVVAHFEAIGPILPTYATNFGVSVTPSEIDPTGHAMVLNAINSTMVSLGETVMDDPMKFYSRTRNIISNVGITLSALSYVGGMLGVSAATSGITGTQSVRITEI